MDDAPVRRLRVGRGDQPAVPPPARRAGRRASRSRSTCRRSSGSTPTTRWRWARSGARASRSTRSTTCAPARRHPARRGLDVDDDQRAGVPPAAPLRARRRGAGGRPGGALSGTIQNDILKEYVARGNYIFPPRPSRCASPPTPSVLHRASCLSWNTISISRLPHPRGRLDRGAGARIHDRQRHRLRARRRSTPGSRSTSFAPRLSFFFNAHNDFFEEVAKFRAARMLWAEIMRDRFGARDQRSQMLRFHAQTGGSTLTAQQPENNVVRVAVQALSAVCGGAQSLHTNGYDEALALPTRALGDDRAPHTADHRDETGAADTADPLGGSYYVEALTDELSRRGPDADRRDRPAGRRGRRGRVGLGAGRDRAERLRLPPAGRRPATTSSSA